MVNLALRIKKLGIRSIELTLRTRKRLQPVALEVLQIVRETQLFTVASSLAYTTILSIVPFLAVSFSIFQAFKGLDKVYATIQPLIIANLAQESGEAAMETIRGFIDNIHTTTLGVSGLIALIFTSMSMLSSAERGINSIWRTQIRRSLFQRISTYWLFITLGPVSLSAAIGFGSSDSLSFGSFLPSWSGAFICVFVLFYGIYKWVPNRNVHWYAAIWGAVLTATSFNLARVGYALYVKNVVSYNKIYGSLGAIPILLLWIYILWIIVLMGAALSAGIQKRLDLK